MDIDVSIILVNYKTPKMTSEAIDSIKEKSSGFSYEIIVVDNSEDENEYQELCKLLSPDVKVIDAKANLGFGKANNLEAKEAKGKFLYFINTDTQLINNAIYELFAFSESHYPCIAGSNLYTKEGKPNHSFFKEERTAKSVKKDLSLLRIVNRNLFRRSDFNYSKKPLEVKGWVCGASLMVPKVYFDSIDGFDKDIFMYAEETLLCYRLRHEKGLSIYNVPSSQIIHFEGGSMSNVSEKHINIVINGDRIYFTKAFGIEEYHKYLQVMTKSYHEKTRISKFIHNKRMIEKYSLFYKVYSERLKEEFPNK